MGHWAGNIFGGADATRKYLVGASFSNPGIIACGDADTPDGLIPCATTTAVDSLGLATDTATYSATPAVGATGIITVHYKPFNIYGFRANAGATEGTALDILLETSGDAGTPDTITATLPTSNSMVGGTVWRYHGEGQEAALRESRIILTHTSTTSLAVTVDFERDIAINDQFIMVPWSIYPGDGTDTSDANTNVQFTTGLYEANAEIASGTGAVLAVYNIIMKGSTDSYVQVVLTDHPYMVVVA